MPFDDIKTRLRRVKVEYVLLNLVTLKVMVEKIHFSERSHVACPFIGTGICFSVIYRKSHLFFWLSLSSCPTRYRISHLAPPLSWSLSGSSHCRSLGIKVTAKWMTSEWHVEDLICTHIGWIFPFLFWLGAVRYTSISCNIKTSECEWN